MRRALTDQRVVLHRVAAPAVRGILMSTNMIRCAIVAFAMAATVGAVT